MKYSTFINIIVWHQSTKTVSNVNVNWINLCILGYHGVIKNRYITWTWEEMSNGYYVSGLGILIARLLNFISAKWALFNGYES